MGYVIVDTAIAVIAVYLLPDLYGWNLMAWEPVLITDWKWLEWGFTIAIWRLIVSFDTSASAAVYLVPGIAFFAWWMRKVGPCLLHHRREMDRENLNERGWPIGENKIPIYMRPTVLKPRDLLEAIWSFTADLDVPVTVANKNTGKNEVKIVTYRNVLGLPFWLYRAYIFLTNRSSIQEQQLMIEEHLAEDDAEHVRTLHEEDQAADEKFGEDEGGDGSDAAQAADADDADNGQALEAGSDTHHGIEDAEPHRESAHGVDGDTNGGSQHPAP